MAKPEGKPQSKAEGKEQTGNWAGLLPGIYRALRGGHTHGEDNCPPESEGCEEQKHGPPTTTQLLGQFRGC